MTYATKFIEQVRETFPRNCHNIALEVDAEHTVAEVDGLYRFYYFSDGSSAGTSTRHRGKNFQVWEVAREKIARFVTEQHAL